MTLHRIYFAPVLLAALILNACASGTHGPTATPPLAASPMQAAQPLDDRRDCNDDQGGGDVKVMPCRIRFDSHNPGPDTVAVRVDGDGPGDGHDRKVVESDDCAARGIATVTQDTRRLFTVTAGTTDGSCRARFRERGHHDDDRGPGRHNDDGQLTIVNRL